MEKHSIIICILLAIITTNLIRVVPMLLIKGQISNRFLRSFLYYVQTTLTPLSGIIALVIGIIAAWRRLGLFPVAAICCAIVYLIDTLII